MLNLLKVVLFATLFKVSVGYFWTKGTQLMDSNGKPFIVRGINTANADQDFYNRPSTYYDAIASTGANAIRILWLIDSQMKGKSLGDKDLVDAIQQAIKRRMVPIVELWSYTGSQSIADLKAAGDWWVSKIDLLKQFEDKLLINIANEWSYWKQGRPGNTDWVNGYGANDGPIKKIRAKGWKGTLIVDSAAYAQSSYTLLNYAQQLMKVDGNLLFSLHLYADWREASKYDNVYTPYEKSQLVEILKKGIPLLIGEFSDRHPDSDSNDCYINARKIMEIAQQNNIGYLGWSWKGNGKDGKGNSLSFLDVTTTWNCAQYNCLSDWGKMLIHDKNGINATARKASVF